MNAPKIHVLPNRREGKACAQCGERLAIYLYKGSPRHDKRHPLCFRCYRSIMSSYYSRNLAA